MSWRNSKATNRLREQVNAAYPYRSHASDGTIGDPSHASRASDHNPNSAGVVCALDITHDPANGCDAGRIAESVRPDNRLNYVIYDRRISDDGGPWTAYHGSNPHEKHAHISVHQKASLYDDGRDWPMPGTVVKPKPRKKPVPLPHWHRTLREGSKGKDVIHLQKRLIAHGYGLKPDGDFGPYTEKRVRQFQRDHGLKIDGIVGRKTWLKLK